MPRRRLKPEDRREEMLTAAEKLFRRHGAEVRVEDIVAAAGAAKGTFYTCFATWDDLLDAIRQRKLTELGMKASALLDFGPETDWPKLLPALARIPIDFILRSGGLHDVLFHSDFTRKRPLPKDARPPALIAKVLAAGMNAKAYRPLDPEPMGVLIFALMHETADAILAGADRKRATVALDLALHRLVFATS